MSVDALERWLGRNSGGSAKDRARYLAGLAGLFAVTFIAAFTLFLGVRFVIIDGYARLARDEGFFYAILSTCGGGPARIF